MENRQSTKTHNTGRYLVQDKPCVLSSLLRRIDAGDRLAFEQLYRQVAQVLASYARRWTDNAGSAEEVLQEALLAIWGKASSFDPAQGAPMTWLRTIVRNQAFDLHRRQMARLPCTQTEWDSGLLVSAAPDPCEHVESLQANAALMRWLQDLGEEPRRAIELTWLAELSHRDAATVMKKPLGTVKTMVRRGLLQLRQSATSPRSAVSSTRQTAL